MNSWIKLKSFNPIPWENDEVLRQIQESMSRVEQAEIWYGLAEGYFNRVKDGKKKPLILHIHGGPHGSMYRGSFTWESAIR